MERAQKRMKKLKEKRRAEEEAKRKAAEEAARGRRLLLGPRVPEKGRRRQWREGRWPRRVAIIWGLPPSEASTSAREVEVEIPRMINKRKGRSRVEVTGGDPDNGGDNEEKGEKAPCEILVLGPTGSSEEGTKW
ncbi:hypothetical protein F5876DRAFT_70332 [Lentinula aff. lateritia]|uniref:Uncharacterized protein n=1 Tax=Lentinula aff. lateritia TaxID=2804960 RepID=A0ACC1TK71_9AGAR|nr:hypothetical protein F5876DRAFT_70332 [Lentinula aff. lateritia]